mgnify:CR=1 FL=1
MFEKKFECNIKFKAKSNKILKKLISIDASHHMGGIICGNLKDKSVLNLGYIGNGPLIEYSILREYFKNSEVEKLLESF